MKAASYGGGALGAFLAVFLSAPTMAQPTPGNAPGSQTGDTAAGFIGIAGAPQANLFTGAAEATIPIEAPPGRLGQAPALMLSYSSSAGPSAYGYGWTLALPRIARSTRHGVPRYTDEDTFVLAMPGGVVELEPVPGSERRYRARIESTFPRIGFHRGQNYWKVIDKGGTQFTFGTAATTRTGPGASADQTFSWLLERIEDPAGNTIDFAYRIDAASGRSLGFPDVIRYGANPAQGAPHFADVRFQWSSRPNPTVSYRSGFAEPLNLLLTGVETRTHGLLARRYDFSHDIDETTADAMLVGATLTAFAQADDGTVRLPSTVFLYGDPVTRNWPTGNAVLSQGIVVPNAGRLRYGKRSVVIDTLDINGDSIVDHLDIESGTMTVQLGTGSGFGSARTWNWPAAPKFPGAPTWIRRTDSASNLETNVFDIDGDGFADLVDTRIQGCGLAPGLWCVWRGSASGFASTVTPWRSPGLRLRTTTRGQTRVVSDLLDVDGDGRLDYVDASPFHAASSPYWNVYRNEGNGFAASPRPFAAPLPYLARMHEGSLLYSLFDMNADGLPDLVSVGGETATTWTQWDNLAAWHVYYNTGSGLAAASVAWQVEDGRKLPNFLSIGDGQATMVDLVDMTGDGRPDLVRPALSSDQIVDGVPANCGSISCYSSLSTSPGPAPGYCCQSMRVFVNTGSSFSAPIVWKYPSGAVRGAIEACPFTSWVDCGKPWLFQYDLFDFNGDGLVDFVVQGSPGDPASSWRVFLHPATPNALAAQAGSTRTRPHLLVGMLNGVGGETLLAYGPASAAPASVIPFPFWTVKHRELRDGVYDNAPVRTTLAYRGGRYDATDRELRGFAMVWEVDGAGLTRVREFAQDDRLRGRLQKLSLLARPACPATNPQDPEDPCSPWRFIVGDDRYEWSSSGAVLLETEIRTPYSNQAPVENLRTTTRHEYDDLGNETLRSTETPLAATVTVTTSYERRISDKGGGMPQTYVVNKPVRITMLEDGRSRPLLERTFEYDWEGPAKASLLSASACMDWSASGCTKWSTRRFSYDRYGNVTRAVSSTGVATTTTYDEVALFPVRTQESDRAVTTSSYDPRCGKATMTRTPNGTTLHSSYDGLGRVLATWGPGTSEADPLGTNEYVPGAGGLSEGPPRVVARRRGAAAVATFFDGLGREVGRKTLAETGGTVVGVVAALKKYDSRGHLRREAVPFAVDGVDVSRLDHDIGDAPAWIEYEYDDAGRRTETTFPDGSRTKANRSTPGIVVTYDANTLSGAAPGAVTIELFDGLDRLLQRDTCSRKPTAAKPFDCPTRALERSESWFYDALGRTTERRIAGLGEAPSDAVTTIGYDGLGNRKHVSSGSSGTWTFEHDTDGRLLAVRPPDSRAVRSSYDRHGRLYRRTARTSKTAYRYHTSGGGRGKVRRIVTRTAGARLQHDFAYDQRGRLTQETWVTYAAGSRIQRWMTRYGYDDLDRRVSVEHPLAGALAAPLVTTFNQFGQPNSIASEHHQYVLDASYDIHGRPVRIDYANGLSDRIEYEPFSNPTRANGRLRCLRTTLAMMPGEACDNHVGDREALWYRSYDPNGNLLAVDDLAHSPAERIHDSRQYSYDALGRLATATYGDGQVESFDFDPLDNLLRNGDARLTYGDDHKPNQATRIAASDGSRTITYDGNGFRSGDGDTAYRYDDFLRLREVRHDGQLLALYGYEDSGARAFRYDTDRDEFRFEYGSAAVEGDDVELVIHFGGRIGAVARAPLRVPAGSTSVRTLFLHPDHQATPRLVTDAGGAPVERSRFSAYGRRRATFDREGRELDEPRSRYGFTGQQDDAADLVYFGERYYDPASGSFLTLDPEFQFASPYAYSGGNPVIGRDADGRVFALTAIEIVALLAGTASFIDSIVSTGNLGQSLTAGVTAGVTVLVSSQLSSLMVKPPATGSSLWLQHATSIATQGFQLAQAVESIEDGRFASGILTAGLTAAFLIGIETANDPGPGTTDTQRYDRHGIVDRGVLDGKRTFDVSGVCATRPGCVSNLFTALRENLAILFRTQGACVGGCEEVKEVTVDALNKPEPVHLRCNSFGAIKCLRAIQDLRSQPRSHGVSLERLGALSAELTGAPILRPPVIEKVTYHVNLFDPVVWVGTAYTVPFRSDVMLGRSWWLPAPLIVHHDSLYHSSAADVVRGLGQ